MHEHSDVHITIVQMPALNTPQFSWVLSRLPKHPQPVPPIYQPEIAARAVVFAAEHPRRKQYWVGASTAATTLGQRLVPALLDRYLATNRLRLPTNQATGEPEPSQQPVGARRRRCRQRSRCARHVRRPFDRPCLRNCGRLSTPAQALSPPRARQRPRPSPSLGCVADRDSSGKPRRRGSGRSSTANGTGGKKDAMAAPRRRFTCRSPGRPVSAPLQLSSPAR